MLEESDLNDVLSLSSVSGRPDTPMKLHARRTSSLLRIILCLTIAPRAVCFLKTQVQHHSKSSFGIRLPNRIDSIGSSRTHISNSNLLAQKKVLEKSGSRAKSYSARSLAVDALLLHPHLPIADRLSSLPAFSHLSLRDRAFCRLLVSTVERRQGQIDSLLEDRLDRKPPAFVHAVLRVGVAQIVFLDTPPHAAVQATVSLVRHRRHRGFVNAILRRIITTDQSASSSIILNAAPWLVEALTQDWGASATEAMIDCAMKESPRVLTVDPKRVMETFCSVGSIEEAIPFVAAHFDTVEILPQGSIRVLHQPGPIQEWPLFDAGVWWCQDPSATLPALALQSAMSKSADDNDDDPPTVVDMCAAPGGKTGQLVSFGYHVTAVDVSTQRCERLHENLERIHPGGSWKTIVADGTTWMNNHLADAVLLDVPCSATGTASKRPDVLRKDATNVQDLLPLQQKLAQHAVENLVRVGGILVYSTCSILKTESEDQVRSLLDSHGDRLQVVPFQPGEIPGFDVAITEEGWIRVLPGNLSAIGACDGFFVARLRRIA